MKKIFFIFIAANFLTNYSLDFNIQFDKQIQSIISEDEKKEKRSVNVGIEKYDVLCVSLGFNCTVALNFNQNQIRLLAFPFDWIMTSFTGLCELIENNFIDFLNPMYLRQGVFNTKYNIGMPHDFPTKDRGDGVHEIVHNFLDFLPDVNEKYQRRIERFYNVCNLANKVYFFRIKANWKFDKDPQNLTSVIKLRNILIKKFPYDNWELIVISSSDKEYKNDWKVPKVKNFYISDDGSEKEWKEIFKKLNLVK